MDRDLPLFPETYRPCVRTVLRFSMVMTAVSLLAGIAFQESSKKLPDEAVRGGIGLDSVLPLALVHGHAMTVGVLLPLGMLGALALALACGARPVKPVTLKMLTRVYLPAASATLALMLVKGYHVLLSVRAGEADLLAIDAAYLGGARALRHALYGLSHTGMAVGLGLFLFGLWRSLRPRPTGA